MLHRDEPSQAEVSVALDRVVAHRHGRRPRARRASNSRRRSLPRAPAGRRRALPRPHQQLDVHAARPRGATASERTGSAGGGDLDVGAGDGEPAREPASRRIGVRDREAGLTTALHGVGYTLTDKDPDYVVLGETRTYSFLRITLAIRLVLGGARFIATNPDPTGPAPEGPLPATGSVAALISCATGFAPYFVGKPNPLMMRYALNAIGAHSETTAMIGDRMDTDVVAGLEAGMYTVLVLTGSTIRDDVDRYPYRPSRIVESVADLLTEMGDEALAPPTLG
jgi:hypothetical protein